jgi:hypothetical protein
LLSYPSSIALSAWRYVREAVDLLAVAGDDLAAAVARIRRLAYAILDGTLIPIDRVADQKPYYSGKHKRHGVNVQVIADPAGRLVWASPALPGAVHDLTAARTVGLIDALTTADVLTFADRGYQGAGGGVRHRSNDTADGNGSPAGRKRSTGPMPTSAHSANPPSPPSRPGDYSTNRAAAHAAPPQSCRPSWPCTTSRTPRYGS